LPVDLRHLSGHHAADLPRMLEPEPHEAYLGRLARIRVEPVAQGGMDAKMGTKKTETKKQRPVTIAVSPVSPPSAIPAPLSINAVTGEQPKRAPMDMQTASQQYAMVDRGKSPLEESTTPQKRTIEYSVAVASIMSTYRNVKRARAN
jgi:hypothetical protein